MASLLLAAVSAFAAGVPVLAADVPVVSDAGLAKPVATPDAREVLREAYLKMNNKGGAKFNYTFKLGSLFNRQGTFMFKGAKSLSWNKKDMVWCDGKTVWSLNRKQRVVRVLDPAASRKGLKGVDEQLALLLTAYTPTMKEVTPTTYVIHLKANSKKVDAKEALVTIDRRTGVPSSLRVKIMIFWGTITISNFEMGNYRDEMFVFPRQKFADCKVVDKR